MRIDKLKIDKYFHLYSRKNDVVFEEVEKPELKKKGKWIGCENSEHWKCSQCGCRAGYWFNEEDSSPYALYMSEFLSNYCQNCGADMRGEDDDIPIEYFENGGI